LLTFFKEADVSRRLISFSEKELNKNVFRRNVRIFIIIPSCRDKELLCKIILRNAMK
jgi:hypothetical protein